MCKKISNMSQNICKKIVWYAQLANIHMEFQIKKKFTTRNYKILNYTWNKGVEICDTMRLMVVMMF